MRRGILERPVLPLPGSLFASGLGQSGVSTPGACWQAATNGRGVSFL